MGKRTPLYAKHVALHAKMVDFSGWEMPVQYTSGILQEHKTVRTQCGLFDTCHMGEIEIEAEDVRHALNLVLAGDFRALKEGRERYTFLLNQDGGVVDDAVAMIFSKTRAWVIVNAGDIEGDFAWMREILGNRAELRNRSSELGKLDLQGPTSWKIIREIFSIDLRTLPFYSFIETEWHGEPVVLSRSGYTGELGAEFYICAEKVGVLWDELLDQREEKILPCGLGARDTLRLESGLPLYGHELTLRRNPLQAGFEKFVSLEKPEDSPGKRALQEIKTKGFEDILVGLRIHDPRTPRAGFEVCIRDQKIGEITSGGPGITVGYPIAMAYVQARHLREDPELEVRIRDRGVKATLARLPFYSNPESRKTMPKSFT